MLACIQYSILHVIFDNTNFSTGLAEISDKDDRVSRAFHQVEQIWFFVGRLWSDSLPPKVLLNLLFNAEIISC